MLKAVLNLLNNYLYGKKIFNVTLDTTQLKMENNNVNYLATCVLLLVSIAM